MPEWHNHSGIGPLAQMTDELMRSETAQSLVTKTEQVSPVQRYEHLSEFRQISIIARLNG